MPNPWTKEEIDGLLERFGDRKVSTGDIDAAHGLICELIVTVKGLVDGGPSLHTDLIETIKVIDWFDEALAEHRRKSA